MSRILLIILLAFAAQASAQVYKFVDGNGIVHYTDRKPASGKKYSVIRVKCKGCGWRNTVNWRTVALNNDDFQQEILAASARYSVEPSLVRAVIHAESWFQIDAVSDVGAQGLMQLMPATQKRLGVTQPFDAGQNIDGGVRYLRELLDMFEEDYRLASAAFNAGENAVKRFGGIPPYTETENFVKRVGILKERYRVSAP
ncbi:MAG: transglycosylase SLT domain-containing protein [Lysobacterales bacterium]